MKNNKKIKIAFLFLIFSIAICILLFMRRESDYFWHIKAGEYMVKNGLLKKDVFSWFVKGKYWFSHEWLFEVILYYFKLIFGKVHILVYGCVCYFTLLLIIFLANKKGFLKNVLFSLIWLTLSLILVVFAQARPHLISFNLLALTIYLLFDLYKNADSKKIFLLPIISLIWANVHGGCSNLPYIFCLIFIVGGLFDFEVGKIKAKKLAKKQIIKYIIVMILCMGFICINIHGVKMLIYPYTNMLNKTMINSISEWRASSLQDIAHLPYFVISFVILMIFLISEKKISFLDFLLFISVLFLGLRSIRFWGYTYIVMSFVIFNYIKATKYDKSFLPAIIVVAIAFLMLPIVNYNKIILKNIESKTLDDKVIQVIKKEKPKRLFNMYDYGGELVYNDVEVFIDGRADLYSNYNYEDYLNISSLKCDYVALINKYNFDYFLVDKSYSIYTYLKYSEDYENIYDYKNTSIFKTKELPRN